jgi:hypothetical protein
MADSQATAVTLGVEVLEGVVPELAIQLGCSEAEAGWGLVRLHRWLLLRCRPDEPLDEAALVSGPHAARVLAHVMGVDQDPEVLVKALATCSRPVVHVTENGLRIQGLERYDAVRRQRRKRSRAAQAAANARWCMRRVDADAHASATHAAALTPDHATPASPPKPADSLALQPVAPAVAGDAGAPRGAVRRRRTTTTTPTTTGQGQLGVRLVSARTSTSPSSSAAAFLAWADGCRRTALPDAAPDIAPAKHLHELEDALQRNEALVKAAYLVFLEDGYVRGVCRPAAAMPLFLSQLGNWLRRAPKRQPDHVSGLPAQVEAPKASSMLATEGGRWGQVLEVLRQEGRSYCAEQLARLRVVGERDGVLVLEAVDRFFRAWVVDHFRGLVEDVLDKLGGGTAFQVEVAVGG